MKSYELLRAVFKKVGCKNVARELNRSETLIHKWSRGRDGRSEAINPLDNIAELIRITGDRLLPQWVCQQAGGIFVLNPKVKNGKPSQLMPAENKVLNEFGSVIALVSKAAGNNSISHGEAEDIRKRWEELKSVTEGFVKCCEHGDFKALRTAGPSGLADFAAGHQRRSQTAATKEAVDQRPRV